MKSTDPKIIDFLSKEVIAPDLKAENKEDVLKELTALLYEAGKINDRDKVFEILLEREQLSSTGIGFGVAIPHGKYNHADSLIAAFGRSKKGVAFEALDQKPVHLFFLFLASEKTADAANLHLKILARSCRLLKRDTFRESLMQAEDEEKILKVIAREEGAIT